MKTIIKQSLKQLVADRYLLVLLAVLFLLALIAALNISLSIHPSEIQVVSHYSAFGGNFYKDQWFYLSVFAVFELIVAILHIIISVKLLIIKGHPVAIMFAWIGFGVILLGWITARAVLNVNILI